MPRRVKVCAGATGLGLAVLLGPAIAPASAHAIIELNGVSAVAGRTSTMTLEIQHGCLPSEATTEVEAFVGAPWRGVRPGAMAGWASTVEPLARGGWHIIWTNLGAPVPFGTETFFPISVDWPAKPGTYGMRVTQQCTTGTSYDWNTQYGPATANSPSPPLTPRPEVKVVAKPSSAVAKATVHSRARAGNHLH